MKLSRLLAVLSVSGGLLVGAAPAKNSGETPSGAGNSDRTTSTRVASTPPVLRSVEPADTSSVVLPGLPSPKAPEVAPAPVKVVPVRATVVGKYTPPPDPDRPILRRAPRPVFPEDFQKDSAAYCHKRIGQWTAGDARALIGVPKGERPAYDDHNAVNGEILAFDDPTGHYRQLELDFDSDSGNLRTVFVYPWKMSWQDCRRAFGANVTATDANKGRKFYSYLNRRLDVLVDSTGQVISLGMY